MPHGKLRVNRAFCETTGYSTDAVKTPYELLAPGTKVKLLRDMNDGILRPVSGKARCWIGAKWWLSLHGSTSRPCARTKAPSATMLPRCPTHGPRPRTIRNLAF